MHSRPTRRRLFLLTALAAAAIPVALSAQTKIGVEGAITAVNGTRIELYGGLVKIEAAGARIDTEDPAFKNISDFRIGTFVDVEAVVETDGTLRATLVEVSDEKDPAPEVSGVIGSFDSATQSFTIGPLRIHMTSRTKLKDLSAIRAGLKVEVRIQVVSGRLEAELVERDE